MKLVCISGAITIIVFVLLSLGNDAGCWRCVLDPVTVGRMDVNFGGFAHTNRNKESMVCPGLQGQGAGLEKECVKMM